MKQTRWAAAILALMLLLAACGGDDSGESSAEFERMAGDEVAADGLGGAQPATDEEVADGDVTAQLTDAAVTDRKVIRTGQMTVQADDTRALMDDITALVDSSGGYVSSTQVSPTGEDRQPAINITIRVPAGELDTALASIRAMAAEVISESIQSQDVTEEYVDIESRLRNLTALETELVALLREVREQPDADPQKLLSVFNEVSRVRGEIEVLEGRRRLLDNQASLSTITIAITPTPSAEPIVEEGWQPLVTARQALRDLVDSLQSLGDAAIWFVVFALPVLLILATPVVLFVWFLRRLSRRRAAKTVVPRPSPAPSPEPAPAAVPEAPADQSD